MGQVSGNLDRTFNQIVGRPPEGQEGVQQSESEAVQELERLTDTLGKEGITKEEAATLLAAGNILLALPTLSAPDRALVEKFMNNLANSYATGGGGGPGKLPILNGWMDTGTIVDTMLSSLNVMGILAKIARQDSVLQQAMSKVTLAVAKELQELAVQSHELRARQMEQEAAKLQGEAIISVMKGCMSIVEMGMRGSMVSQKRKEMLDEKGPDGKPVRTELTKKDETDINTQVASELTTQSNMYNAFFDAARGFFSAGQETKKADLEKQMGTVEGVKELLDKIFQMMTKTLNDIQESRKTVQEAFGEMARRLQDLIKARGEHWRASQA